MRNFLFILCLFATFSLSAAIKNVVHIHKSGGGSGGQRYGTVDYNVDGCIKVSHISVNCTGSGTVSCAAVAAGDYGSEINASTVNSLLSSANAQIASGVYVGSIPSGSYSVIWSGTDASHIDIDITFDDGTSN